MVSGSISAGFPLISAEFSVIWAHLSRRGTGLVEDQAVHIERQVGERDLRLGAADCSACGSAAEGRMDSHSRSHRPTLGDERTGS